MTTMQSIANYYTSMPVTPRRTTTQQPQSSATHITIRLPDATNQTGQTFTDWRKTGYTGSLGGNTDNPYRRVQNFTYSESGVSKALNDMLWGFDGAYLEGKLSGAKNANYYTFNTTGFRQNQKILLENPAGCDYDMVLYDAYGNQVARSKVNDDGTKELTIPKFDVRSAAYTLKVESKDGNVSDASYKITMESSIPNYSSTQTESFSLSDELIAMKNDKQKQLEYFERKTAAYFEQINQIQQAQYNALPDNEKYSGGLSVSQLLDKIASGETLTKQEKTYVEIFATLSEYDNASKLAKLPNISEQLKQLLSDNGITLDDDESLNIKVNSAGRIRITGLDADKADAVNEALEKLNGNLLFEIYIASEDWLKNTIPEIQDLADDINEVNKFLSRFGITVDALSLDKNGYIVGLPPQISSIVNNADPESKNYLYYDYKCMITEIKKFEQLYGKEMLPYTNAEFVFQNGELNAVKSSTEADKYANFALAKEHDFYSQKNWYNYEFNMYNQFIF